MQKFSCHSGKRGNRIVHIKAEILAVALRKKRNILEDMSLFRLKNSVKTPHLKEGFVWNTDTLAGPVKGAMASIRLKLF